jgi:hypothetical protein
LTRHHYDDPSEGRHLLFIPLHPGGELRLLAEDEVHRALAFRVIHVVSLRRRLAAVSV